MRDVFICDAIRTPIGRFGGALAGVRADDLAAIPLKALPKRPIGVRMASQINTSRIRLLLPGVLRWVQIKETGGALTIR